MNTTYNTLIHGELASIIADQAYATGEPPVVLLQKLLTTTQRQLQKYEPPTSPKSLYKAPEVLHTTSAEFKIQTRVAGIIAEAKKNGIKMHKKTAYEIARNNLDDGTPLSTVFSCNRKRKLRL